MARSVSAPYKPASTIEIRFEFFAVVEFCRVLLKLMRVSKPTSIVIVFACALFAAVCLSGITSAQNPPVKGATDASSEDRPLTPAERRGRALFLRGESASKREITAIVNDLDVPATTVPCAGCHGRRGEGKAEG